MVCDTPLPEMIVTLARAVLSSFAISWLKQIVYRDRIRVLSSSQYGFEHGLDVLGLRKEVDRLHAIDGVARARRACARRARASLGSQET